MSNYSARNFFSCLPPHSFCPFQVEAAFGSAYVALMLPIYLASWHTFMINLLMFILFQMRMGMSILGKDQSGVIPPWSYLIFAGFHVPNYLYTSLRKRQDEVAKVAMADEVVDGWWIGGRYGHELKQKWAGVIDLTVEFPESCLCERYLNVPCWDGTPPTPELLDRAAAFGIEAKSHGPVLVHCAHGRGRSTCTLCACLVKAGLFSSWQDAFQAVKKKRQVVGLNKGMRNALEIWQQTYVTKTK